MWRVARRGYCSSSQIRTLLKEKLNPVELVVQAGPKGGTLQVDITADAFVGKRMLEQHRMVNDILKNHIKEFHAVILNTKKPN